MKIRWVCGGRKKQGGVGDSQTIYEVVLVPPLLKTKDVTYEEIRLALGHHLQSVKSKTA